MSKAVKSVSKAVSTVLSPVQKLFGGGGSPGALGTGLFQGQSANVDPAAFKQQLADDEAIKKSRAIQAELTETLRQRALGQGGPSLAELSSREQSDRNLAQVRGGVAGLRGRGGALAARGAQQVQAASGQDLARQLGMLRAQEQLGAQAALAQQTAQQLGTDIDIAGGDRASKQALENLKASVTANLNLVNQQGFAQAAGARQNATSSIGTALGAGGILGGTSGLFGSGGITGAIGGLFSDKDLKKDVKKTPGISKDFLDKLNAVSFQFKDKQLGEGEQVGILAQDLEKAGKAGKAMVVDTPIGKAIDAGKGFGTVLAVMSDVNERLKKIEEQKGRLKRKTKVEKA